MLEFFATSGDFTRRLTSIRANPKFSTPLAGPEDFYSVSQTACVLEKAILPNSPFCVWKRACSNLYNIAHIYFLAAISMKLVSRGFWFWSLKIWCPPMA